MALARGRERPRAKGTTTDKGLDRTKDEESMDGGSRGCGIGEAEEVDPWSSRLEREPAVLAGDCPKR